MKEKKKTPRRVIYKKDINTHLKEIKHTLYKAAHLSEDCDERVRLNNMSCNWLDPRLPRDRPALGASLAITSLVVDINHTHNITDARYVALSNKLKCSTCARTRTCVLVPPNHLPELPEYNKTKKSGNCGRFLTSENDREKWHQLNSSSTARRAATLSILA